MKKRVYTLYRVSTIGQVEKDDIPMQKEACHEFAERQGWEIVKEFSEKGVSGFKKSAKDRDQLQLLQQAAAAGEFDVLLVFMFDRLGRRDDETPFIVEWFTKQGVEVWSVNEGQQRFDSHVDKLMNYIRYWQASGESIKTSIRTRTRIEQLTEEGHYTGGTVAFGYKRVQKFSEILECSKSKLLQDMLRKDMEVAQKEVSRAKSELDLKDDERNALKDEMIRVIRGKSSIDRDMIQQLLDENQAAIQAAQDALTAAQNKLEEIEQENKKAENDCSNLFTWASTYQNASFQQRQAILNQFIKEVRVGRDYDIEIILNVPLEEFEEFKSHSLSVRTPSGRKTDLKQAPVRGLGTPNGGIVVFDKTSGEAMNIMPKSSAHVTLRCQDE